MSNISFSSDALKTLKSMSGINSGMVFKPGHNLEVAHPLKHVIGRIDVGVEVPVEFAIYDIPKFLGVVSLHDKDSMKFDIVNDALLTIKSKKATTKYRLTDKMNVVHVPDNFSLPKNELGTMQIKASELDEIKSVSNSLGLPHVVLGSDPTGHLTIVVKDIADDSTDEHDIFSESDTTGNFNIVFTTENLSLIQSHDYCVEIHKQYAYFKTADGKVQYWVTTEV